MGIEFRDWVVSASLHLLPFLAMAALFFSPAPKDFVELRFEDMPEARLSPSAPAKPIEIKKPIPPKPSRDQAVYGLSKRAHTSESSDLSFKTGNTIAKEKDEKILTNEPDSLPVPTDEYLVTRMPTLKEEIRIPYPESAKANRIQGAVVMDLLIDQEGIVRDVLLIGGPGGGLDGAALEAVRKFRFTPAYRDAEPVAVRIRYAYRFVLEK